jgi:hypothetical protein
MADVPEKADALEKADAVEMVEKADAAAEKDDAMVEKGDVLETLASNFRTMYSFSYRTMVFLASPSSYKSLVCLS